MHLPKTIAGIPVIFLILLPCMYCLYFQGKQQVIRYEMRQKLESEQVQTVIVPVKDFKWYEEGREIIVDGMMFDVKSMIRQGDNYLITGLFDERETELHIALGRLHERSEEGADASLVAKVLSTTWVSPAAYYSITLITPTQLSVKRINPADQLYNTFLSIQTPPPRC